MTKTRGKYPNSFYRVSLKAIIRHEDGRVLIAKEDGGSWNLPGGGIDHEETADEALTRELKEEVCIEESFRAQMVGTSSMFLPSRDAYLLWIVYELSFEKFPHYGLGEDADDVDLVDPHQFKDSEFRSERLIYKFCVDPTYDARLDDI